MRHATYKPTTPFETPITLSSCFTHNYELSAHENGWTNVPVWKLVMMLLTAAITPATVKSDPKTIITHESTAKGQKVQCFPDIERFRQLSWSHIQAGP